MSRQERPLPSDRDLMPPPPRPRPPALFRTIGTTTTPIILSDTESESSSDDDDGSASSTPHARARGPQDATQRMLDDLRSALQGTNCCCGGSIPITPIGDFPRSSSSREQSEQAAVPPGTLRFDTPDGLVAKVQFPLHPASSGIEDLLRASSYPPFRSSPGSERIGELDASHFSTDFHPHDHRILDNIARTLLPGIERPKGHDGNKNREDHWGVRAELRALNVYSPSSSITQLQTSPSTQERESHFGTLIVSLPSLHQGGNLNLTHKSQSQSQIFSTSSPSPSIQWLAFHNTSTLSTQPVSSGYLITLTYTLFISEAIDDPLHPTSPSADPAYYPLHPTLTTLLSNPSFLPSGGTLGFFTTNTYPHTLRNASSLFPSSLRGIDAAFFSVCSALNLAPTVRPILGDEAWDENYEHVLQSFMDEEGSEGSVPSQKMVSRIGRGFGRIKMVDVPIALGEDPTPVVNKYFPFKDVEGVVWLNEARHEGWEVQMVNLRGGDEGGLMWHYSCVGILVRVKGYGERMGREEEDSGME